MIFNEKFKDGLWVISFDVHGRIEEAVGKTMEAAISVMHAVIKTTIPERGSVWIDANNVEHRVKNTINTHTCRVVGDCGTEIPLVDWHYDMQIIGDSTTDNLIARLIRGLR